MQTLTANGNIVGVTKNLLEHATTYYKDIFDPAPGNMFQISPFLWNENDKMNDMDNPDIIKPFEVEEEKNALFAMKKK
jgi:hypothetical protein